ncbi:MAG: 50S ribosomal protein L21 [Christensenellales bacterium]|jgi:large subunit ribosomal protein L21
MFAVALAGGKQYKVSVNDLISVEKVNAEPGGKVSLDVIMISDNGKITTGNPIKGASVEAEVVKSGRGRKITVFTYKPKKNIRKKQGHRQAFSLLKIVSINTK